MSVKGAITPQTLAKVKRIQKMLTEADPPMTCAEACRIAGLSRKHYKDTLKKLALREVLASQGET